MTPDVVTETFETGGFTANTAGSFQAEVCWASQPITLQLAIIGLLNCNGSNPSRWEAALILDVDVVVTLEIRIFGQS